MSAEAPAAGHVLLILDASGSMYGKVEGKEKIAVAKEVMANLVRDLPDDLNVGLEVYGHRRKGDCNDIEVVVPMGQGRKGDVIEALQSLKPKGETPLSASLARAGEVIKTSEQDTTVVMVSDGKESCNGDPCATIRELRDQGVKVRLHVVGFGIADDERKQLSCMAEAGDGRYFEAKNAPELKQVLAEVRTQVAEAKPEPAPAKLPEPPKTPVSSKTASADQAAPTPLEPGEIVKGRLAEAGKGGKYHYWKVQSPPGPYRVVLDVKRADDKDSNLQAQVDAFTADGRQVGRIINTNEIDTRYRAVAAIDTTAQKDVVLRVASNNSIVDYWLGVFAPEADVTVPFFVRTPPVGNLEIGKTVTATLDPRKPETREVYFSTPLQGTDYRVSADFKRADGKRSNVQGTVDVLGPLGEEVKRRACTVNEVDTAGKCATKMSVAEEGVAIFRVRPNNDVGYQVTLAVEPWPEE